MSKLLGYQHQESQQTLAEGLTEYFKTHETHFKTRNMTPDAQEFFRCHDVVHVVFGCDISLSDEAVVKITSFFGTSEGLGVMKGYRLAESKEIYEEIRLSEIILTALSSLIIVPRTIFRCLRMAKRWPWADHSYALGTPLKDLRREFGIRVPH